VAGATADVGGVHSVAQPIHEVWNEGKRVSINVASNTGPTLARTGTYAAKAPMLFGPASRVRAAA
jgi:hypothetical protein